MSMYELENKLRKHAETTKDVIKTSFCPDEEIKKMEERKMLRPKIMAKRILVIAAVLVLCITAVTITPFASSIKGFFKDIVRFDGAITGTRYENATNEIKVHTTDIVTENGVVVIPLELTFENPTEAPFIYLQEISVADCFISDSANKEVFRLTSDHEHSERGWINGTTAFVTLSMKDNHLKQGEEYTLVIEKMYGYSKADAPLHISGNWQCKFIK